MKSLPTDITIKQFDLLALVADYKRRGLPTLMSRIATDLHLADEGSVRIRLRPLLDNGYLTKDSQERTFTNLDLTPKGRLLVGWGVPLLGSIPAGPLTEAIQDAEEVIDVPLELMPWQPGDFFLRVKGDSMIGDGILDGDKVLLRPGASLRPGEIAAVQVGDEYRATLKHVHYKSGGKVVTLRASNPKFKEIVAPAATVEIVGAYRGLVRGH